MKEICKMKGCKRPLYIKKHKLCSAHYQRFRRFGDPGDNKIRVYRNLEPLNTSWTRR